MIQDMVAERLHDWTRGLNEREARIRVFERIRDVPYTLIQELIDPEKGPIGILTGNKGSCSPKHYLLGLMLRQMGIPTNFATCLFRWGDAPVDYPPQVRSLAEQMPIGYHLACRAYVGGRWILVDATWDPPLANLEFPVNENWDGLADTHVALVALGQIIHESARQRAEYVSSLTAWHTHRENDLTEAFYSEFNKWIEAARAHDQTHCPLSTDHCLLTTAH